MISHEEPEREETMAMIARRAVLSGALAGTGLAAAGVLRRARAQAAEVVRVAMPGVYTPLVAVVVAQDEGYFREKGITTELTTYRGGGPAQEALAAGAADLAPVATPGAALAMQRGVRQKITTFAGPPSPRGWYLLVPQDSPVRSAADLVGKRVGVTAAASSTDFFRGWTAQQAGGRIQAVPLGAGIEAALRARQIDAGVLWPLGSIRGVASGAFRLIADYGTLLPNTAMDVWVATQAMIDGKPEVLRRWLQAVRKAIVQLQGDRAFALRHLARYHEEDDQRVLGLAYEQLVLTLSPDGAPNAEWIDNALRIAELGGVSGLPRADALVDARFVPTA
jgi:NitT/TauT family transport system substrate-binding protein